MFKVFAILAVLALSTLAGPPTTIASPSAASPESFCHGLGGSLEDGYCHVVVVSPRKAVRDIELAIPELTDDPVIGSAVSTYLRTLSGNWRTAAAEMVQDSHAELNYRTSNHRNVVSVVFHEEYRADGSAVNDAYRTFTFDTSKREELELRDIFEPGPDPLARIADLAGPYLVDALNRASPAHEPNTYPFTPDRWAPNLVFSGAYRAWALAPGELIVYMPDYPVAHDVPVDYRPGAQVWSMDGGTVQAHIPLTALTPALRPEYRA